MARLTLSQTGISSPLDIGAGTAPSPEASGAPVPEAKEQAIKPAPESQPPSRRQPQRRSRRRSEAAVPAPAPVRARGEEPAQSPAQGGGYPIQTSIPVDIEILDRAIGLSWSAGVALNTLIVATLQRALPATAEEAVELAVLERVDHPGAQRVERNVRLPRSLRSRLDELSGRTRGSGIKRGHLVGALIRQNLPESAEDAAALCAAYIREQALASLRTATLGAEG